MLRFEFDHARNHYRALQLQSEIERADPHRLVMLLYDELALCVDVLTVRARAGRRLIDDPSAHRARSIVLALRSGLDFSAAGGLASSLDTLYAALADELEQRLTTADADRFAELRASIETLREAWQAIGS